MQIQIMFLLVSLSCEMSREEEFFSNEKQGLEKSETMDYIEAKEYIMALRKLLPELQNTRNKTQTCKLVIQELKINEETDLNITRSLITKFKKIWANQEDTSPDEVVLMLSCLEHFMNDFNNAHEFEKLNGIEDIFHTLGSSVPIIKAEAARLLATAALHSPKVQISVLRSGVIAFLLKSVVLESDVIVRINSMLAITCILKDYPGAQAKFVEVGGLRTLAQIVEKSYENDHVLIKVIALIHDLVEEHKKAMRLFTKKELQTFDLYQAVGFEEAILNQGWCLRIARLLIADRMHSRQDGVIPSEHWKVQVKPKLDLVEKVCETLLALVDTCHREYVNFQFKRLSKNMENLFITHKHLLNETVQAKYSRIIEVIGQLTREMDKFTKKDEL